MFQKNFLVVFQADGKEIEEWKSTEEEADAFVEECKNKSSGNYYFRIIKNINRKCKDCGMGVSYHDYRMGITNLRDKVPSLERFMNESRDVLCNQCRMDLEVKTIESLHTL